MPFGFDAFVQRILGLWVQWIHCCHCPGGNQTHTSGSVDAMPYRLSLTGDTLVLTLLKWTSKLNLYLEEEWLTHTWWARVAAYISSVNCNALTLVSHFKSLLIRQHAYQWFSRRVGSWHRWGRLRNPHRIWLKTQRGLQSHDPTHSAGDEQQLLGLQVVWCVQFVGVLGRCDVV